ncbi:MAG: thiamine pyrophosphate-dependent enzyme [Ignavibacteria bacterium]|nr:thiamine pyrophosphate-dependent enzyme [Ignavibacteria bacterium]
MAKNKGYEFKREEVLADYKLANESRQASLIGRKETLMGKANFGIFGDGKEVPQLAMAKTFQDGDFRSGYYRDQTFMMATGMLTLEQFFAQLYGDTDINREPHSGGRGMNNHFGSRLLDENGRWKNLMKMKNTSSDIAPTASQMQRLLGLAYASKLYRNNPELSYLKEFSNNGNEVAFGTIGNASTAEGIFFETINAAGVLMVPMAISIWDDGFGISVPNIYQMTKSSISEILKGFEYSKELEQGFLIYRVPGWDYEKLVNTYQEGISIVREKHIPAIFHITELTQPQGHSTSGSHERYKTKERLEWEREYDCIRQFRKWILEKGFATEEELTQIEEEAKVTVKKAQQKAWEDFLSPIKKERDEVSKILLDISKVSKKSDEIKMINDGMYRALETTRRMISVAVSDALLALKDEPMEIKQKLIEWNEKYKKANEYNYGSHLYSQSEESPLNVKEVKPIYKPDSKRVDGREILLAFFDYAFKTDPRLFAIGEDIGRLGDVNQGMAGLQAKYGDIRITDTGIREATIAGQGIGAALRGLRPIVEIQYLDYLLYALQIISDDLALLHWRTKGGQKAPVIIRTRGHRLVGIFHSGSPMGMITHAFRGLHVCVPRNMTQAAGFYNTLLKGDDPGLVIERLNAYRIKELLPENIGEITVPLGVPEVLQEGTDITIVTYGACVDIAKAAINKLEKVGISVELIDVRTLLPFDRFGIIKDSIKKTNKVLFLDEDVPGGATAFMMQQVLDEQNGYKYLDSPPRTLTGKAHRPAYGNDGDYYSKPNAEEVFSIVYEIMHEYNPTKFPRFF